MTARWIARTGLLACSSLVLALAACQGVAPSSEVIGMKAHEATVPSGHKSSDYLFLWSADEDKQHEDFLAVMDVRHGSPKFGQIVATLPVGEKGTVPHHTEHELDASGELFANGFASQHSFVFDLNEPERPRLLTNFKPPPPFSRPHSYARLPNGNLVVTLQEKGGKVFQPGGLMEVTARGAVVRTVDAADDAVDPHVMPYSAEVVPALDRLVTTSADMHARWVSQAVQVWTLPDLERVRTIVLPPGPNGKEGWDPAEARVLGDGSTVLVGTFSCGLYLLEGLETSTPGARFIHDFGGGDCALPVVVGHYWVQTVPDAHALVALDVSEPSRPREVSRLIVGDEFKPHWIAAEPSGRRIVLTGYGPRVLLVSMDPATGKLGLIESFRDAGAKVAGVSFNRTDWPHGSSGNAVPHGAVFDRAR